MVSFIRSLCHEGTISILLGLPGSGKTSISTFFMQQAVKHGYSVFTNIHFFEFEDVERAMDMDKLPRLPEGRKYEPKPKKIHTVTTISDLLLGLLKNPRNTTFIDEGGFFATSTMATSTKVRQIKELAFIIRHLNSSFIIVAQSKGSVVPDLRKTLVTYELEIEKISSTNRTLSIRRAMPARNRLGEKDIRTVEIDRIGNLPMPNIPWDGYFLPKFKFDIDLTEAFDELGEYNSMDVLEKGPDIIKKLKAKPEAEKTEKGMKREEVRDEARELYLTLEDSGCFKNRTELLSHVGSTYGKTTAWAYTICRDLPFDKDKYNPKVDLSAFR